MLVNNVNVQSFLKYTLFSIQCLSLMEYNYIEVREVTKPYALV